MFGVRIHGRGGQGVVTAAELLSVAAFEEGRYAQAVPSFGSERTGAPVVSFCRIADQPIRLREPLLDPHVVLVQDPTLLHQIDVLEGLREDGWVLVDTSRTPAQLNLPAPRVITVPASRIARAHLGRPLPGAALLGGLAALDGIVAVESVAAAYESRFPGETGRANAAAAREAHDVVRARLEAAAHA